MKQTEKTTTAEIFRSEFCKIISEKPFCAGLLDLDRCCFYIPELKSLIGFPQNNPHHVYDLFGHTIHAMEQCDSEDLIVRLAVFFHDFGKPHSYQDGEDGIRHFKGHGRVSADIADRILGRLGFDNEAKGHVVELIFYHDATFKPGKKYVKRWLHKISKEQFRRLLEVRRSDIKGQKPDYEKEKIDSIDYMEAMIEDVLQEKKVFSKKDLVIGGNDVKEILMLEEGKDIGYWLQELSMRVASGELDNHKSELCQWLRDVKNLETQTRNDESVCYHKFVR